MNLQEIGRSSSENPIGGGQRMQSSGSGQSLGDKGSRQSIPGDYQEQDAKRGSVGSLVDHQARRRSSSGTSGSSFDFDKIRRTSSALLMDDIINGCSDMKALRMNMDTDKKLTTTEPSPVLHSTILSSSCAACTCGRGDINSAGGKSVTLCTECSNNGKTAIQTRTCESLIPESQSPLKEKEVSDHDEVETLFHVLPWQDVIFSHIFRCLPLQDIFRLRATGRIGRDCVNEYFSVCPNVNLARCSQKVTPTAFRLVTYENYKLNTLILRQARIWLNDDVLIPAFACSSHIAKVDLTACSSLTPKSVVALAGQAPGLRELYLRECPWMTKEAVVMLAQNCPLLEKLDLTGCWAVDDEAVIMVSMCCRKLVFLSIAKIYGITDYAVRCLSTNCTLLQHVNMHGCWRVTDGAVQLLGEYCRQLRLLQVKECRDVTELSLARLRARGVKVDVNPPIRRGSHDAKNLMQKLKLQV